MRLLRLSSNRKFLVEYRFEAPPRTHTHIKRKIPHFTTLLAKTKRTPWRGSAFLPGAFGKVRKREIADTYRMRQIEQQ